MVSTQVWLQADGDISDLDFETLLKAMDHERSPRVQEVGVDYEGISEEQVKALIPAMTHNRLHYFEMAIEHWGHPALSANVIAAVSGNDKMTHVLLLLGNEHFYFRGDAITDEELMQIFHEKVTLHLESITDEQLTILIDQLKTNETKELSLTITQMEPEVAQHVAEMLRHKIPSIEKLSLSLGTQVSTVGQDIGDDFIVQFAALMQEGQNDLSDLATTASGYANSLLTQGKSWLSALTTPMTACMSLGPDLTGEEEADIKLQEKLKLGKLA
ncbi:hypothetical protein [Candidatus Berkiella aquae]|uniref:Uncharacterized protein n=1 Tax=Candidatus Berkiella aquae TaxID=295108 RepID=A0A0Q9YY37_9GAMM|nr:hypothetical protein [Candidatus Berkiella aquae]MCS5711583.1 hypothetical protein [Candidatus Berkiella aquae]